MKRLFLIPALFAALLVSGCAGNKVGDLITVATSPIPNPVSAVDIYRTKAVYAATLQVAVDWRNYCYSKPYKAILADPVMEPVCHNRRRAVRAIKDAKDRASLSIIAAVSFVSNHPTLDATSLLQAAWAAATSFKNSIPVSK